MANIKLETHLALSVTIIKFKVSCYIDDKISMLTMNHTLRGAVLSSSIKYCFRIPPCKGSSNNLVLKEVLLTGTNDLCRFIGGKEDPLETLKE